MELQPHPTPQSMADDCLAPARAAFVKAFEANIEREYARAALRMIETAVQVLCCIHEVDGIGLSSEVRATKAAVNAAMAEIRLISQELRNGNRNDNDQRGEGAQVPATTGRTDG